MFSCLHLNSNFDIFHNNKKRSLFNDISAQNETKEIADTLTGEKGLPHSAVCKLIKPKTLKAELL